MTNLTRRTLLRGVTVLTAAAALPGSGVITSFTAWAQTAPGKLEDIVRALFFDVFGTMVDWRTGVAREAQAILKPLGFALDWLAFADAWRAEYQPGMDEVRTGRIPFSKLDVLHRRMLDRLRPRFGLEKVDEKVLQELTLAWHRLDAWKDVPPRTLPSATAFSPCARVEWEHIAYGRPSHAGTIFGGTRYLVLK